MQPQSTNPSASEASCKDAVAGAEFGFMETGGGLEGAGAASQTPHPLVLLLI